jgi:hypothetical protein
MSGIVFRARSDTAGRYKLMDLPRGRHPLWVKAAEHDSEWIREVVVEHGKTTHHDVRLEKSGPLPLTSGRRIKGTTRKWLAGAPETDSIPKGLSSREEYG